MAIDVLFALRGLLAFIAFTEWTNAIRCLIPIRVPAGDPSGGAALARPYVVERVFNALPTDPASEVVVSVLSHVFALYALLNGLVLIHLAIYAHYRPLVSLALASVLLKLLLLLGHLGLWGTISPTGELAFPLVSGLVALGTIAAIPMCTSESGWGRDDENRELLRQMNWSKKRAHPSGHHGKRR